MNKRIQRSASASLSGHGGGDLVAPGRRSRAYHAYRDVVQRRAQPGRPSERTAPNPADIAQEFSPGGFEQSMAWDVEAIAARGVSGAGGPLPHDEVIARAFGRHDVSGVRAHVGGAAGDAAQAIGARAYATGAQVAFQTTPDLHTASHEAAHVVQQRGGVQLKDGVGRAGDVYEQHADAVADAVVAGRSAEALLDQMSGGSSGGSAVQRECEPGQVEVGDACVDERTAAEAELAQDRCADAGVDVPMSTLVEPQSLGHDAIVNAVIAAMSSIFLQRIEGVDELEGVLHAEDPPSFLESMLSAAVELALGAATAGIAGHLVRGIRSAFWKSAGKDVVDNTVQRFIGLLGSPGGGAPTIDDFLDAQRRVLEAANLEYQSRINCELLAMRDQDDAQEYAADAAQFIENLEDTAVARSAVDIQRQEGVAAWTTHLAQAELGASRDGTTHMVWTDRGLPGLGRTIEPRVDPGLMTGEREPMRVAGEVIPVTTDDPDGVLRIRVVADGDALRVDGAELEGVTDHIRRELVGRPLGSLHIPIWVTIEANGEEVNFTVDEAGNWGGARPSDNRAAAWLTAYGAERQIEECDPSNLDGGPQTDGQNRRRGVEMVWNALSAHPLTEID